MAKNFEKLIFGGLHEKHAVQRVLFKTQLHRFVRTSQETHYVSAGSPTG
jgi:hypothetical protein